MTPGFTVTEEEREELERLIRRGKPGARQAIRARILLLAAQGWTDEAIVEAMSTSTSTIYRARRRFVEGGLEYALRDAARPGGTRKLDGKHEALLVSIACLGPPEGQARWTLQLLADRLVALSDLDSVSVETVRRRLHEKEIKPWQKRMWCILRFDANYVAHMEDVLDLYAEPADLTRPVVCFDETLKQLVEEVRAPLPREPGKPLRYDYHYRRAGTANLFVFIDRHRAWRHVKVTGRKTNRDFAECMRDLVDVHYPNAETIRVVLDNLSTHRPGALYTAFPPEEARRILRKIEFHYTPKHASWLNMVEIEIGILSRQCLDQRIPTLERLQQEAAAWELRRNDAGATIRWMFNVDDARTKLARAYPGYQSEPL